MFAILNKNHCEIIDNNLKSQLIKKGFGFKKDLDYFIDLFETKYLFDKKKIKVKDKYNKIVTSKKLLEICNKQIKNFEDKYIVFSDFRDKGNIVKDGSIFGFDFRVYKNSKGNKHTHTDFVVDVKRTYKDTMSQTIKSERLANSIHTKYIIAIVDNEQKINKIKIERII